MPKTIIRFEGVRPEEYERPKNGERRGFVGDRNHIGRSVHLDDDRRHYTREQLEAFRAQIEQILAGGGGL